MGRARAAQVHEEAISHVARSSNGSAEALLEYGCEEPVDLLVQGVPSAPRDVAASEARSVADVLTDATLDDHVKVCEACRKSGYALGTASTRGLAKLTRKTFVVHATAWRTLCIEGKQICEAVWAALGLGLPDYAQESS